MKEKGREREGKRHVYEKVSRKKYEETVIRQTVRGIKEQKNGGFVRGK